MELADLQTALGPGHPTFRARQIYDAVYRRRVTDLGAISTISKSLKEFLAQQLPLGLPEIERRYDSVDGTRRYLLRLDDGKTVEAVWMPEAATETAPARSTICISSQVGCPVNCGFCLTALMGLERNLSAGEIAGQVLRVASDNHLAANSDRVNIVMMGQGEPLLNLPAVIKATRLLTDADGIAISARRITLSTSGIVPKILEMGREPVRPKLAVSLNASTEEQRRELMPITRKYHLKDLLDACRKYPLRPWEKLTFEYVLLKGVNDSDADARRVVKLLANLDTKVNLIALNPGPGIPFETPDRERVVAFQEIVKRSMPCFIRKPRGLDVFAACGQLKRMENALVPLS
ncbi:MAG TPA: 23S rRNA (adenine(2503)-C(2))-methyltransferase RlmN [Bryobacteraceae bacterium]|nr:23S rRNA (adenine(2503)-C(2))-methyltransferase RlmN [Bryobacteraceae bacterium]